MSTAVWIDEGHPLDAQRLRQHGIVGAYFSHRFDNATKEKLAAAASAGFQVGIYSAWNWYDQLSGAEYAQFLSDELRRIAYVGNPQVCVDIETHDVDYIMAFFAKWRQVRPGRPTQFTFEGWQGGLYSPANVHQLVAYNLRFVPQLYRGDMSDVEHSPVIDLLMSGFPGDRIDGFYNAAHLPYRWRGFAFTQATLS